MINSRCGRKVEGKQKKGRQTQTFNQAGLHGPGEGGWISSQGVLVEGAVNAS